MPEVGGSLMSTGYSNRPDDANQIGAQIMTELEVLGRRVKRLKRTEERYRLKEQALKEAEARYRRLFETAQDGILILDGRTGRITEVNRRIHDMLGFPESEIVGSKLWEISAFLDIRQCKAAYQELRRQGQVRFDGIPLQTADGQTLIAELVASLCTVKRRTVVQCNIRDVSERKRVERQLEVMATHDPLTGLPNRTLLYDRFQIAAAQANRRNKRVALMTLDLDHFKVINDTLGHDAGDGLLKVIAARLGRILRKGDTIARLGGDEFVLLLPDIEHAGHALTVAHKVLAEVRKPLTINGNKPVVTVSIGIAVFPDDGTDLETLMKNADLSMYGAKENGRNTCALSQASSRKKGASRMRP